MPCLPGVAALVHSKSKVAHQLPSMPDSTGRDISVPQTGQISTKQPTRARARPTSCKAACNAATQRNANQTWHLQV